MRLMTEVQRQDFKEARKYNHQDVRTATGQGVIGTGNVTTKTGIESLMGQTWWILQHPSSAACDSYERAPYPDRRCLAGQSTRTARPLCPGGATAAVQN